MTGRPVARAGALAKTAASTRRLPTHCSVTLVVLVTSKCPSVRSPFQSGRSKPRRFAALTLIQSHSRPETKIVIPMTISLCPFKPITPSRAADPRLLTPTAPAKNMCTLSDGILTPFPNVAVHIVKAQRIRFVVSDPASSTEGISLGCSPERSSAVAICLPAIQLFAEIECGSRRGPASIFPFPLGGQFESFSCPSRKYLAAVICVHPRHVFDRVLARIRSLDSCLARAIRGKMTWIGPHKRLVLRLSQFVGA